jgi:predicted DCC family thiol-disulfide oxidoreductase YuxK
MSVVKRTIYYDGLCQLCSREIEMFQARVTDGSLAYVDISLPDFDATAHGVDPVAVNRHMHVRDEERGRMLTGVNALLAMWECAPGFRWLAWLTRLPVVRPLSDVGYEVFAWVRPKLPKRRRDLCDTGRCPV